MRPHGDKADIIAAEALARAASVDRDQKSGFVEVGTVAFLPGKCCVFSAQIYSAQFPGARP